MNKTINLSLKRNLNISFRKTPKNRRIDLPRYEPVSEEDDEELELPDYKLFLMKKSWKIFNMTPLYRFSYEEEQLRTWSKELRNNLKCELNGKLKWQLRNSEHNLKVQIKTLKGIKMEKRDAEAVTISVSIIHNETLKEKELFNALLCSAGLNERDVPYLADLRKCVVLPIMLCCGRVKIMKCTQQFLRAKFLCHISQMIISPSELRWMLLMWPGADDYQGAKCISLSYRTLDNTYCNTSVEEEGFNKIWKSVHDEDSSELSSEEVEECFKFLHLHFWKLTHIDFDTLKFCGITTSALSINVNSTIKFHSMACLKKILQHLCRTSMDQILPI